MAYFTGSRDGAGGSIARCRPTTLEDVLCVVTRSQALTPRQQQDMASALRTLARLLSRPLSCFRATCPRCAGFSKGSRRRGTASRVGAGPASARSCSSAIELAGVPRLPGRSGEPLSPAWLRLLAPLPYRPFQVALLPFARSCSRQNIEPDLVDQATFERFARDLEDFSGRSRPREAYLDACRAWNRAGARYRHWPAFRVRVAHRRKQYALDWAAFPASLKADIDAMASAAISPTRSRRQAVDPSGRSAPKLGSASFARSPRPSCTRAGIALPPRHPRSRRTRRGATRAHLHL